LEFLSKIEIDYSAVLFVKRNFERALNIMIARGSVANKKP